MLRTVPPSLRVTRRQATPALCLQGRSSRLEKASTISPVLVLLLSAAVALLTIPGLPITHDVIWQLWIARQMNAGIELYAQLNEVNPPLWFWMAMPLADLGAKLKVEPTIVVQVAIISLCLICCLISNRLLSDWSRSQRSFFLVNAFWLGLLIPLANFAQREQIAMVVALPYVLLSVRRVEAKTTRPWFALCIGLLAATGIALKHYFIAVPLLLELWMILSLRSRYRPFRPETIAFLIVAGLYALSVWRFSPAFFTHQLPMVLAAYGGYSNPLSSLLMNKEQAVWAVALAACLYSGVLRKENVNPLTAGLFVAFLGFLFSYFAQNKGWVYHSMPATFFLLLILATALFTPYRRLEHGSRLIPAAALLVLGYVLPLQHGPYESRFSPATSEAMAGTPRGEPVFTLSSSAQRSWPMIVNNDYIWPSRYMSLWMIPGIVEGAGDPSKLAEVSDRILAATVHDLRCTPPHTLLVERRPVNRVLRAANFDYVAYFTEHPDAKSLMNQYSLIRKTPDFLVYHRRPGATFGSPRGCRTVH